MLPNYLAQTFYRSLRKSGMHSDVGVKAFTSHELVFMFYDSYVTSSILMQFSFIPSTGLLEWWPKFINRSDLVDFSVSNPSKPNMLGNILVIFAFFGGGIAFSITCFVLEFWRFIVRPIRIVCKSFAQRTWNVLLRSFSFSDKIHRCGVKIIEIRTLSR